MFGTATNSAAHHRSLKQYSREKKFEKIKLKIVEIESRVRTANRRPTVTFPGTHTHTTFLVVKSHTKYDIFDSVQLTARAKLEKYPLNK